MRTRGVIVTGLSKKSENFADVTKVWSLIRVIPVVVQLVRPSLADPNIRILEIARIAPIEDGRWLFRGRRH